MIWEYREISNDDDGIADLFRASARAFTCGEPVIRVCPFCTSDMRTLLHRCEEWVLPTRPYLPLQDDGGERDYFAAHVCVVCGWWNVFRRAENWRQQRPDPFESYTSYTAAWAVLKKFDFADVSAPTEELIRYLVARYAERYRIHPRKFEEIVAAIYAGEGYSVRVTSYSGDRGLDVIVLDGPSDKEIGIQVRRNRGVIQAEAIRSLAGAMLVNGVTQGAFITTSSYSRGARETARLCRKLGHPIELIDAESFYDRLRLRRRALYRDPLDSSCPFRHFLEVPISLPPFHEESRRFVE